MNRSAPESPPKRPQADPTSRGVTLPQLTLPKGGGAIRSLGEKFAAQPVTGTGSMTLAIGTSPGRSGFGPQLALSYDSAAGSGPFGFGWGLSLPAITRKTDKGIPQYRDAEASDVFVLSGAEDLVPALDAGGQPVVDPNAAPGFTIQRFRPRVEGSFARIERWTRQSDGDVHWRILTSGNVLSVYGRDAGSRITDPADDRRVFSWLLCETRDDRGNAVVYTYKPEDATGVDVHVPHERARGGAASAVRKVNRYIKSIRYGNRVPLLDPNGRRPVHLTPQALDAAGWMFEVVFDYGEHDPDAPTPGDPGPWLCRNDPHSSYRAGFEVRTYRLCQRVLMFHHFPGEAAVGADCLVRATGFEYRDTRGIASDRRLGHPEGAFLAAATQRGYLRNAGGYTSKALPPVSLEYTQAALGSPVRTLDAGSAEHLPAGVDGVRYRWVDLDGEGLPGVLVETEGAWYYKPNLGEGRLGALRPVVPRPAQAALADGQQALLDLAGDGRIELVQLGGSTPGFQERDDDDDWAMFVPFASQPNVDWSSPNLRFVDLTGDGLVDLLVTEDEAILWYESLGERGFGAARRLRHFLDEERGPRVLFGDGAESLFLADMSGDGLADVVRVRNGEVCYWPNLGYGRFGAKITMGGAPRLDRPDAFDPRRVRLADVDGSGTTDLLYLGEGEVLICLNQSGNGFGAVRRLTDLPHLGEPVDVQVVDLLGRGTACLVWSSPLPADAGRALKFVDLTGGVKPHLLVHVDNHMGAETRVRYAPSTQFYLADRLAGRPWITRLPFPVHVVDRVEVVDHVARTRFVSTYSYHHGHYDGTEREFRGFARVEQQDTEAFEDYVAGVVHIDGTQELAPEFYQPPITTRTWYHTGAWLDGERILHQLRDEYYLKQQHVPEPSLPQGMNPDEHRECLRALKGVPLRQEIYSLDGSPKAAHPYSVTDHAYEVRRVQARVAQRHAVFFTFGSETVSHHYERDSSDPRVTQSLLLEVGPFGNPIRSASVIYGRKGSDPTVPAEVTAAQRRTYVTYTENEYTPDHDLSAPVPAYRLRTVHESRAYEITGVAPASSRFTRAELAAPIAGTLGYEVVAGGATPQKRLLSHTKALFRDDSLAPLPAGQWGTLGLGYESYTLALPKTIADAYYGGTLVDADYTKAGYVHLGDQDWWIPSGTALYPNDPAAHFYLASGSRDPQGLEQRVFMDAYDLLPERVQSQAPWNESRATNDYRVLGPVVLTDPNQNRSAVELDALGFVVKTAVMGKAGAGEGDTLADPTVRLEYDLFNWNNNQKPNYAHTFSREKHGAANPRWQESYVHFDGSGGVAMVKAQARPGKALQPQPDGTAIEVDADPRWVGNGRTIHDNKGHPVKKYDPYFSTTHEYEDEKALRMLGATPILTYDAAGRNVRTDFPEGTFARVVFDAWTRRELDANDTCKQSQWYADRGSPDPATQVEPVNDPERRAAWLAAKHADTPEVVHFDGLGRPVYAVSDFGGGQTAGVRSEIDLTGRLAKTYDPLGRLVASGFTGMAGTPIHAEEAEKGKRWTFVDVAGAVLRTWDEHGRGFRIEYDALRRPLGVWVDEPGQAPKLFQYVVYGDRLPNGAALNLLGAAHQTFDQAGMIRVPALDFKGNPVSVERVLTEDPTTTPNWSGLLGQPDYAAIQAAAAPALDLTEPFTFASTHDALNRPIEVTLHGGTVLRPKWNEANFLSSLQVRIQGQPGFVEYLKDQDYDAKGRRRFARYGNDVLSHYFYDPHSLRLARLLSVPFGVPETSSLQDLRYTYDPVGNLTQYRDEAQQTRFFANQVIKAEGLYEYDSLYQLIKATGREHASVTNNAIRDHGDLPYVPELPHVNDTNAIRNYTERYEYDLLGNIVAMRHIAGPNGSWTRHYRYAYQDDPTNRTNRLASTSRPGDPEAGPYTATYDHDPWGNLTHLRTPNPGELGWSFLNQLERVDLGGGGTAHYVYGAAGRRVRKVIHRPGGERIERIYLGAMEIYRERKGNGAPHFERRTFHIADDAGRIAQVDLKIVDDDGLDPDNAVGDPLVRYQYGNHLGSATLETDEDGVVVSYEEYHPFGTTAYCSSKPGVNLSLKRYRFAGKEHDGETGLYYIGARYFAPWLGRWTSPDPAGLVEGTNLYRYCGNNPITLSDPSGTQSTKPLNPAGEVSWIVPKEVFQDKAGKSLPNATAVANFESWMRTKHPDRPFTPGSATIDWSKATDKRGPVFNAEWLGPNGKPLLPRKGEFGYVEPMRKQDPAQYSNPAAKSGRLTENEHNSPHAQQKVVEPSYGKNDYRNDVTTRSPRDVSLDKTRGDNAASRNLAARAAAGGNVDPTHDVDLPSHDRFQQANERARAAGRPHIDNPGSITRGTLEQMNARWERGKGQSLPPGAVVEDFDLPKGPPPPGASPPAAPKSSPPSAPSSGGSGPPRGPAPRGGAVGSGVGGTLARTFIPFFAEVEVAAVMAEPFVVGTLGVTSGSLPTVAAAISAAPTTTAFAVTLPAIGGAVVGNVVESAVRDAGGSKEVSIGAAVGSAALVGAAIGTCIPVPGVSTAAGALIGAGVGIIGYGISKLF